jgi:hypothetical protein
MPILLTQRVDFHQARKSAVLCGASHRLGVQQYTNRAQGTAPCENPYGDGDHMETKTDGHVSGITPSL